MKIKKKQVRRTVKSTDLRIILKPFPHEKLFPKKTYTSDWKLGPDVQIKVNLHNLQNIKIEPSDENEPGRDKGNLEKEHLGGVEILPVPVVLDPSELLAQYHEIGSDYESNCTVCHQLILLLTQHIRETHKSSRNENNGPDCLSESEDVDVEIQNHETEFSSARCETGNSDEFEENPAAAGTEIEPASVENTMSPASTNSLADLEDIQKSVKIRKFNFNSKYRNFVSNKPKQTIVHDHRKNVKCPKCPAANVKTNAESNEHPTHNTEAVKDYIPESEDSENLIQEENGQTDDEDVEMQNPPRNASAETDNSEIIKETPNSFRTTPLYNQSAEISDEHEHVGPVTDETGEAESVRLPASPFKDQNYDNSKELEESNPPVEDMQLQKNESKSSEQVQFVPHENNQTRMTRKCKSKYRYKEKLSDEDEQSESEVETDGESVSDSGSDYDPAGDNDKIDMHKNKKVDPKIMKIQNPAVNPPKTSTSTEESQKNEDARRSYSCYICAQSFSNIDKFKNHYSEHDKGMPKNCIFCKYCDFTFFYNAQKQTHMSDKHPEHVPARAAIINKKQMSNTTEVVQTLEHSRASEIQTNPGSENKSDAEIDNEKIDKNTKESEAKEKGTKSFSCFICRLTFSSRSNLTVHIDSTHRCTNAAVLKKYTVCPICNKYFRSDSVFREHKRTHERVKRPTYIAERPSPTYTAERPFSCHLCDKRYHRIGSLRDHYLRSHEGTPKCTMCKHCDLRFFNYTEMKAHMIADHPEKVGIVCKICKKTCRDKWYLKYHEIRSHSMGERKFKCNEHGCEKSYVTGAELNVHMQIHTGLKYKCGEKGCHRAFFSQYQLNIHTRRHTGEKPFMREICSNRFTTKAGLDHHAFTHKEVNGVRVKPWACKDCDARFTLKNHLTTHSLKHTGERRHLCEECGSKFKLPAHLRAHLKTHMKK